MTPDERREAIRRTTERIGRRKADYTIGLGLTALKDIARFCRAAETTFHPTQDARTQAMLEGRRQVWLRIEQHLKLSPEELLVVYRAAVLDPTGATDG